MNLEQTIISLILLFIFLIFILSFLLVFIEVKKSKRNSQTYGGGLIIIGPVIIPFGYFTKYKKELTILSIIIFIIILLLLLKTLIS